MARWQNRPLVVATALRRRVGDQDASTERGDYSENLDANAFRKSAFAF